MVNELDFALLEFAHHRFDIAHLKVREGVIGLARSPAEDHRLSPAITAKPYRRRVLTQHLEP